MKGFRQSMTDDGKDKTDETVMKAESVEDAGATAESVEPAKAAEKEKA